MMDSRESILRQYAYVCYQVGPAISWKEWCDLGDSERNIFVDEIKKLSSVDKVVGLDTIVGEDSDERSEPCRDKCVYRNNSDLCSNCGWSKIARMAYR